MNYRISKRTISSGIIFIVTFIAAIYLTYIWVADGMPFYTNRYNPGNVKSFFPIIFPAMICAGISVVAGVDAYIHSKED